MAVPTKKEASGKLQGLAQVRNTGDGVMITLDNQTYDIAEEDVKETAQFADGEYWVRMSATGTQLWSVKPGNATVLAKFVGFGGKPGELPLPQLQAGGPREFGGKKWVAKDKYVFYPTFEIVKPKKYRGLHVSYICDYLFKRWEQSEMAYIPLNGKSADRLVEFLKLAGLDFQADTLTWSENLLPALEEMLLPRAHVLQLAIKNGNVDTISEPMDDDE